MFRGCGGLKLTSPKGYSAAYIDDVRMAIETLKDMYPKAPLAAIGYSLGSMLLTKYCSVYDNTPTEVMISLWHFLSEMSSWPNLRVCISWAQCPRERNSKKVFGGQTTPVLAHSSVFYAHFITLLLWHWQMEAPFTM
eukprot:scaffold372431_cov40-Prasinocladus_malaysianus.AAC.1